MLCLSYMIFSPTKFINPDILSFLLTEKIGPYEILVFSFRSSTGFTLFLDLLADRTVVVRKF